MITGLATSRDAGGGGDHHKRQMVALTERLVDVQAENDAHRAKASALSLAGAAPTVLTRSPYL